MKTLLPKLFHSRLVQAGGLLAIIAAFAASMAWSRPAGASPKLEGAWVANTDTGIRAVVTFTPIDPSSRSATFRNQMVVPPEVLAVLGVEAVTDEIGEARVTGIDTGAYTAVWYGLVGGRVVLIYLDNTAITFDSATQLSLYHTVSAYLTTADADNDGYPDPGSTPIATLTAHSISKRLVQ
jgi:hypothetical protein